ncbi:MAG: hypothetical protein EON98_08630, partial [Chitinophagaceae bacterium]
MNKPGIKDQLLFSLLFFVAISVSPSSSIGINYDAWYRFTVPSGVNTIQITVDGLGSSLNGNNTYIEVFDAAVCGSVTGANSMGFASAGTGTNSTTPDLTALNLAAGGTYYFRVFTTVNPSGSATAYGFNVLVSYSGSGAPSNDNCSGALVLTPGTTYTNGSVANATASASIPAGCATGIPDDDVWFKFTAIRTYATVAVNARSALNLSGDMIQVFSGTCGSLTPVGCGQDAVNLTGLS